MGGEMMSRYLFEFLSNRISFAFIMIFLMLFLELRCSWLISVLTAVFAYLSEFMLGYMCYFTDFGKHHQVLFTAASILLIQGVAFLLGSYRDFRTVFTAVSGSGFIVLGTTMGTVTFLYTRDAVIGLVVVALVQSMIMAGLVVTMRKPYLEAMKQSGRYWKALWIIPSAFFAINYTAQTWPSNLIETPSNAVTCIVSSLTMMICYAILFQMFDMWRKEQKLAEDNRFLDIYAGGLRHEMETIRVAEERTAHWRHDMRHMFRLIAAFAREGENEKCLELLQEMDERIVETRAVHYCDNVTLNGVLSGCAAMAQRENVRYKCQADVPKELENTDEFALAVVLSVGTLGMTDEPMRTTQLRCIETAKAAGAYIAVDPNYRATLWRSEGDFLRQTERLLELADYVKLSDEETALVTGCTDPEKALEALERRGVRTAVVTRDKGGAMALSGGQLVRAAGMPAVAVDATGAGDAFWGGFLYRLLHRGYPMEAQTAGMLADCLAFGNRVGAYCVGHLGAISGMPTMAQLETMQ